MLALHPNYSRSCLGKQNETVYDVIILHDPNDNFTEQELFPFFESNNVLYCFPGMFPGRTMFGYLEFLDPFPDKILIVLSDEFCRNEKLKYLTKCTTDFVISIPNIVENKIITFITTGNLSTRNGLLQLKSTNVCHHSSTSLMELVDEIRFKMPPFCKMLGHFDVGSTLHLLGLTIEHIESNLLGVLILAQNKCVQINLTEFHKYINKHEEFQTSEVLETCKFLRNPHTEVTIVLDKNKADYETVRQGIISICSAVIELRLHNSSHWSLSCIASGKYTSEEAEFLTSIYPYVWSGITRKSIETITKPSFDSYSDIEKRKESFPIEWIEKDPLHIEEMAQAGYFYPGSGLSARCFYCGCGSFLTNTIHHKNPLLKHASQYPECRFVKNLLSDDEINNAITKFNDEDDKSIITSELEKNFGSFEARRRTFDTLKREDEAPFLPDYLDELAMAGFYCINENGIIQCFKCSIRFFYIPVNKNPWVIHALKSPTCTYIADIKGIGFIKDLQSSAQDGTLGDKTILKLKASYNTKSLDKRDILFRPW